MHLNVFFSFTKASEQTVNVTLITKKHEKEEGIPFDLVKAATWLQKLKHENVISICGVVTDGSPVSPKVAAVI